MLEKGKIGNVSFLRDFPIIKCEFRFKPDVGDACGLIVIR